MDAAVCPRGLCMGTVLGGSVILGASAVPSTGVCDWASR